MPLAVCLLLVAPLRVSVCACVFACLSLCAYMCGASRGAVGDVGRKSPTDVYAYNCTGQKVSALIAPLLLVILLALFFWLYAFLTSRALAHLSCLAVFACMPLRGVEAQHVKKRKSGSLLSEALSPLA